MSRHHQLPHPGASVAVPLGAFGLRTPSPIDSPSVVERAGLTYPSRTLVGAPWQEEGPKDVVVRGVTRRLLPMAPFRVADAMEAYKICMVKSGNKTPMPCWRCPVPKDQLNDETASFPDRKASKIYSLIRDAQGGDSEAVERLAEMSIKFDKTTLQVSHTPNPSSERPRQADRNPAPSLMSPSPLCGRAVRL